MVQYLAASARTYVVATGSTAVESRFRHAHATHAGRWASAVLTPSSRPQNARCKSKMHYVSCIAMPASKFICLANTAFLAFFDSWLATKSERNGMCVLGGVSVRAHFEPCHA